MCGLTRLRNWGCALSLADARRYNTQVTDEGAAMFAAAIALVHAIETANSTDTNLVTAQLQAMNLEEFFGMIQFNDDGQGMAENLVVQYGPGYVRRPDRARSPPFFGLFPATCARAHTHTEQCCSHKPLSVHTARF